MRSSVVCSLSLLWLGLAPPAAAAPAEAGAPAASGEAGAPAEAPSGARFTLGRLLDRIATSRGVAARFRERKEIAILAAPLETRGVLYFVPPDRLARFTAEPSATALVVDGASVTFREDGGEPMDLSASPVARIFVENFVALWRGDRERLEALYAPELSGDPSAWRLRLVPRRPPMSRVLESITLSGDADAMRRMEVLDRDGDRTTTFFDRVDTDRTFAPAELERLFEAQLPLAGESGPS